jgi:hypothetical protein
VRRIALAAALCAAVVATLGPAPARTDIARLTVSRATFTGPGIDTCTAPSLNALSAWLTSPYRAAGIYVGGVNRACPDGNLSASWVASATAGGWSLFPLYVGLQAPCVSDKTLARIDPASATAQGTAAATDAAARAQLFGLGPGIPLYFDMEGYSTTDPACTQVVQQFVSAWVDELHALGYVAGIYGSASSTIRDMVPLASSGSSPPDQVDIGNWNGNAGVFGDPYVPDAYWAHHQRIHQYRGGHNETYGGVTLNVDDDYLDGAVAAATASAPAGGSTPAGSVTSADGLTVASWPAGALPRPASVTVTPSALQRTQNGFAAGSYTVQLSAAPTDGGAPITSFAAPVTLRFLQPAAAGLVPAESSDGQVWTVLLRLPRARLPAGATAGYTVGSDGRITVRTTAPAWFGLLRDVGRPTRPDTPTGRISGGALRLAWTPSQDNSGSIARYEILRGGSPVAALAGGSTSADVRSLDPSGRSVFRVVAVDAAGNLSVPSGALLVVRRDRPADAPAAIPAWAWHLLDWQRHRRSGSHPATPRPLPAWYWHWASWELQPYRITRSG